MSLPNKSVEVEIVNEVSEELLMGFQLLEATSDLGYVERTLQKVVGVGSGYLEMDEACEAIAAAEIIARLQGNYGVRDAYSKAVDNWVERNRLVPRHCSGIESSSSLRPHYSRTV